MGKVMHSGSNSGCQALNFYGHKRVTIKNKMKNLESVKMFDRAEITIEERVEVI